MKPLKDYTRDELLALVQHCQERDLYFARLVGIADAGQFRADWDAPILHLIRVNKALEAQVANSDETSAVTRKKLENIEALRALLVRARPFTEGNPLYKEITKFLDKEPEPQPYQDALEIAMIHLLVWHHRYFSDVDESEKTDLNWILRILGSPKRYLDVPDK